MLLEERGSDLQYAISLLLMALIIFGFFALGKQGFAGFGFAQVALRVIVAIPLLVSGVWLHFLRMTSTASIIPPIFPARDFLVVLTGVLEIAGAVGLFVPRWRRAAAFWTAVMMVAIFPANIYRAGQMVQGMRFPTVPVRLTAQIIYILLVLLAGYGTPKFWQRDRTNEARRSPRYE
jgi:uncharacterized membrane protein